jgi:hypothetical protein
MNKDQMKEAVAEMIKDWAHRTYLFSDEDTDAAEGIEITASEIVEMLDNQ